MLSSAPHSPASPHPFSDASQAHSVERLRICMRKLPPSFTQEDFLAFLNQTLGKEAGVLLKSISMYYYYFGGCGKSQASASTLLSAVFISFPSSSDLNHFYSLVSGKAINREGYVPAIEYAPIQSLQPTAAPIRAKRDHIENTIEQGMDLLLSFQCRRIFLRLCRGAHSKVATGQRHCLNEGRENGPRNSFKVKATQSTDI